MSILQGKHKHVLIAVGLAILTLAVFLPVTRHEFLNYDDGVYVAENPHVLGGLNAQGISWAFTTFRAGNWHPLTWISLMLDATIFGSGPFGFHLVSLLLHLANVLLLFLLLSRLTGHAWRSAFVAALFAIHPLHVESVAWVAERKDVLSTLFWMLTTLAYVRYISGPSVSRYIVVLVLYALGLMSKPMLATLPLVLLMLDYWPLGRFDGKKASVTRLVLEKVPLLLLAAGSCIVTFVAQHSQGATASFDRIPVGLRIGNALVSYVGYVGKAFVPIKLSVFYPYPHALAIVQVVECAIGLVLITVVVMRLARIKPHLLVGWLWFVLTLIPVIGLVQVGAQAMADRYTYIPLIGLFVMLSWSLPVSSIKYRASCIVLCPAVVVVLAAYASKQVTYWHDSETLFRHAVGVTKDNYLAYDNLGVALYQQDRLDEAVLEFRKSVAAKPDHAPAHVGLGTALMRLGQADEAIWQLTIAVGLDNDLADAHNSLGILMTEKRRFREAASQYREALRIEPENPDTHFNLACALAEVGELDDAVKSYSEAIRLRPDDAGAHNNLGTVYMRMGSRAEAVSEFKEAVRLDPEMTDALRNLQAALSSTAADARR